MKYYFSGFSCSDELYHHGIPGQKWYVRRFQNPDGTLTPEGKKRYYGVSESTDTGGSGGTSRAHYRVQGVGDTVTNAARKTGQAIGKAGKAVVKYEVDRFKRRHPWIMSNEELDVQILKAKKVNELRTTRESARGKTFVGKLSNTLWKSFGVGTDKLAENLSTELGKGYAKKLLESREARKARELKEKTDLRTAQKNRKENELQYRKDMDKFNYRKDLYENSKRLEREQDRNALVEKAKDTGSRLIEGGKNAYAKATTPKPGSAKAVEEYARQKAYEEEKERRRKLYGPGGTAYR